MGILGIKNVTEVKKRLDQADQNSALVSDGRQNRRNTVVNESGLYDVIFMSRKPQTKNRLEQVSLRTTKVQNSRGQRTQTSFRGTFTTSPRPKAVLTRQTSILPKCWTREVGSVCQTRIRGFTL